MEPIVHSMNTLFRQLGLDDSDPDIEQFILDHRPLPANVCLHDANFWTPAQAGFLKEAIEDDADWAETVDELDARLHSTARALPCKAWLRAKYRQYLPALCGY